jgi:hypothetical protein
MYRALWWQEQQTKKQQTILTREREEVATVEASKKEWDRLRKMRGRSSTILTSPWGVLEEAPTEKKTLLGE